MAPEPARSIAMGPYIPIDWSDELDLARVRQAICARPFLKEPSLKESGWKDLGLKEPGARESGQDSSAGIELVQTHLSVVFLTPKYVFKFKRPVNLSFADFHSLRRRRHYCAEELRLNRRLAPDVYLHVKALHRTQEGFSFEGTGPAVDYAVVMKRLPQGAMLGHRLRHGEVLPDEIDRLADFLLRFHHRARGSARQAQYGRIETWRLNWNENFQQAEPAVDDLISREAMVSLRERVEGFMTQEAARFAERIAGGFIRNGHGDLRCEHVCLGTPIRVIDCIEFNERFRCGDMANDLAFLVMDLTAEGRPDLARRLFARYAERGADSEAGVLMPFYLCYRAFVRGKVAALRLRDPNLAKPDRARLVDKGRRFFALAAEFAAALAPPVVLMIGGLMGSGKSTLAAAIAARTGMPVLASDRIRKELAAEDLSHSDAAISGGAEYGAGIYSSAWNQRTYSELLDRAGALLRDRRSVILDATFSRRADRERAFALARRVSAGALLVECAVSDAVTRSRLEAREHAGRSISDGRAALLPAQKAAFEPCDELPAQDCIHLNTHRPVAQAADEVLARIQIPALNPFLLPAAADIPAHSRETAAIPSTVRGSR